MARENFSTINEQRKRLNDEVAGKESAQRAACRIAEQPVGDPEADDRRARAARDRRTGIRQI